jgi:menaquinone-9 beta-reductase
MTQQTPQPDVFIVGGGPAGLAAAISAREKGFRVVVADGVRPPIDKACGEGLMPDAVAALQNLGVHLAPDEAMPFRGIRFLDGQTGVSVAAEFPHGVGLGVRRTVLHAKLVQRAAEAGVAFAWGVQVTALGGKRLACDGREVRSRWIIGADGQQSQVREWAALPRARWEQRRFGFRQHFRAAPWSDCVEVYWGKSCQVAVTPTGPQEIGLALISRNSGIRLHSALRELPALAARLGGAAAATRERGAPCVFRRLPAVHRGRFALIGDASGSVDPVTGEGLGLAFRQAAALADALREGDLHHYEAAHKRIGRIPRILSRLVLAMDRSAWLRHRALRALAAEPHLFARLLHTQVQVPSPTAFGIGDALRLGWRLAMPGWEG